MKLAGYVSPKWVRVISELAHATCLINVPFLDLDFQPNTLAYSSQLVFITDHGLTKTRPLQPMSMYSQIYKHQLFNTTKLKIWNINRCLDFINGISGSINPPNKWVGCGFGLLTWLRNHNVLGLKCWHDNPLWQDTNTVWSISSPRLIIMHPPLQWAPPCQFRLWNWLDCIHHHC